MDAAAPPAFSAVLHRIPSKCPDWHCQYAAWRNVPQRCVTPASAPAAPQRSRSLMAVFRFSSLPSEVPAPNGNRWLSFLPTPPDRCHNRNFWNYFLMSTRVKIQVFVEGKEKRKEDALLYYANKTNYTFAIFCRRQKCPSCAAYRFPIGLPMYFISLPSAKNSSRNCFLPVVCAIGIPDMIDFSLSTS